MSVSSPRPSKFQNICLTPIGTQICHGFKVITCESKVQVVVRFVLPRELVSFDP